MLYYKYLKGFVMGLCQNKAILVCCFRHYVHTVLLPYKALWEWRQ